MWDWSRKPVGSITYLGRRSAGYTASISGHTVVNTCSRHDVCLAGMRVGVEMTHKPRFVVQSQNHMWSGSKLHMLDILEVLPGAFGFSGPRVS
jgi:hypothetical protein